MSFDPAVRLPRPLPGLSLDHLIDTRQEVPRDGEIQLPGRFYVDDQLDLRALQDRQVGRPRALEDARRVDTGLAIDIADVRPVAREPARHGELAEEIGRAHV